MRSALPYPIGLNVVVYKDDGQWGNYRAWFLRTQGQLEQLFVARITLAHLDGEDEPCYTSAEWHRKSSQLLAQYSQCVFVYGTNEVSDERTAVGLF